MVRKLLCYNNKSRDGVSRCTQHILRWHLEIYTTHLEMKPRDVILLGSDQPLGYDNSLEEGIHIR